jgi:hypothetical protein
MNKEDHYRRNAAYAGERAVNATSHEDRAAWRAIADGWLSLLSRRKCETPEERFRKELINRGTGQDDSLATH